MRKLNFIILSIFFFGLLACNTSGEKIIVKKSPAGKLLEEYLANADGTKIGYFKAFADDGSVLEESQYQDGKLNGKRTIYYPDGEIEIVEHYVDDKLHGDYTVYYKNGQAEVRSKYTEGVLGGILTRFYDDGVTMEEVTFENNIENGPFKEYYETGEVQWEGNYLNGDNEFGLLKQYDTTGTLIKKMMCDSLAICQTIWTIEKGDIKPKKIFN